MYVYFVYCAFAFGRSNRQMSITVLFSLAFIGLQDIVLMEIMHNSRLSLLDSMRIICL